MAVNAGKAVGICPAADAKAGAAIAKAESKRTIALCKVCGGPDKRCDGIDDFTPLEIGFPPTCPDVGGVGAASFAGPVTTLTELASCVGCVTAFEIECASGSAASGLSPRPAGCGP